MTLRFLGRTPQPKWKGNMATSTLIIGYSGTGKSTSIRNLPPDNTLIIRVAKKRLPFRENRFRVVDSDDYGTIKKTAKEAQESIIVIDDVQYLLANEFMRKATEKGYEKFTILAQNFWDLFNAIDQLPDDKTVYMLSHLENVKGHEKFKTIGKLLDEKITIEGLFTIVLKTHVKEGAPEKDKYFFTTKNNGHDTTKSPDGLFDDALIPNDLAEIDRKIREYYYIPGIKQIDQLNMEEEKIRLDFIGKINAASSIEELEAIIPLLKESTLSNTKKDVLRKAYTAKSQTLKGGQQ